MRRQELPLRASRAALIEAVQGARPADLIIRNAKIVNVYSGELLDGNIAVVQDRIAYVGPKDLTGGGETQIIDAQGQFVAPGFIEPHAHPWVLYNPVSLTRKVLPLGTTTMVHDDLYFYLHFGARGVRRMVEDLRALPGLHLWLARIVSQADYDGERDDFDTRKIGALLEMWDVIGTAELTRWPMLVEADPFALAAIAQAKGHGKISDGHTAGASYDRLNAIVAAGISACHEAITVQEVLDRLRLGLWTALRHSSLRPDLPELVKAVSERHVSTGRLLLTTDGPHPACVEADGFVDGLLRIAVRAGVPPIQALQLATLNPATYLGLDEVLGGIAPGRRADLLLLPDLETFRPSLVIAGGNVVAAHGQLLAPTPEIDWNSYPRKMPITVRARSAGDPRLFLYRASPDESGFAQVPVIRFDLAVITSRQDHRLPVRDGAVDISEKPGLVYAALLDRAGRWISHAIIDRLMGGVEGFATTYNTTTQILAAGRDPAAIALAVERVVSLGGGIVLMEHGKPVLETPLPLAGMMTESPSFETALRHQQALLDAVRQRGYPFHDILYSLLFLTCDFLPGPRLTSRGLIDVKTRAVLHPAVPPDLLGVT